MTNLQNKILVFMLSSLTMIAYIGAAIITYNFCTVKIHTKDEVFMNKCTEYTNVENCKELLRL